MANVRLGAMWSLAGAVLAVLVTASTAPTGAQSTRPAPVARPQDTTVVPAGPARFRRPFRHERHESVSCRECHGSGGAHRVTRVRGPTDCATCHHDPARAMACIQCHQSDVIPAERPVQLSLALKVAATPRSRTVRFRHQPHLSGSAAIECMSCHATPVTMARNRECATCHQPHHEGKAECANCHAAPPRGAHNAAVHLSCAGAACHATKAPTPASSRALCLYCHADRRNHEPEGSCALCHRIPGAVAGPAQQTPGTGGGRWP